MANVNNIIERIAKLRALSKSENVHEAETAARLAAQLADKYRISDEEIDGIDLDPSDKEGIKLDDNPFFSFERRTFWRWRLASVIMHHYGCSFYEQSVDTTPEDRYQTSTAKYRAPRRTFETRLRIVGRASDIAIARYMFGWLMAEIEHLCDKEAPSPRFNKEYRGAWNTGVVDGIGAQLKAQREQDKREGDAKVSAALVRLDNRAEESKLAMYELVPSLRKGKTITTNAFNNSGAYGRGVVTGKSINLSSSKSLKG